MADGRVGPVVVRRRLGSELRRLRTAAAMRIEDAAGELECSTAKISRLEAGIGTPKTWDVRNLLTLYGVTDRRVADRMVGWARQGKEVGWWERDAELVEPDGLNRFVALETEASRIFAYCTPVFTALLQTAEYARALLEALYPTFAAADIDRLLTLQINRQSVLTRTTDPLRPTVVCDESAVHRVIGSPGVQRGQLRAVLDHIDDGRVDLRIFAHTAGSPGRALSPFAIFQPTSDVDPVVAQVESSTGPRWHSDPREVEELRTIFATLTSRAMSPDATRDLIARAVT